MKKIYFLTLCALVASSGASAATHFKSRKGAAVMKNFVADAVAPIWRAESQTDYMYEEGEWIEISQISYKYDSKGNVIQQEIEDEDGLACIKTEYNENNRPVLVMTTADYGDGWVNESKRTYVYDPVVTSFYTERMGYSWENNTWVSNYYCETNEISRNKAGNITSIVKSLPWGTSLVAAWKSEWKYDESTGKAVEYSYYFNTVNGANPMWQLYDDVSYRDIVWESTNGQMTNASINEYTRGENKIKSCDVYYNNEIDGHLFVEYFADKPGDYLYKETFLDPTVVGITQRYEVLDSYGSFRVTYNEYFDDNGEPTQEPVYSSVQEITVDEHGNIVMETADELFEGAFEPISKSKVDYAYDSNGNPTEFTISNFDFIADAYVPESKVVFGSYSNVSSGIGTVIKEKDGRFEVFNIQGLPVSGVENADELNNLPSGLYIVNGEKRLIKH